MNTHRSLLLSAALLALALLGAFTLVVQLATSRGESMRAQQRLTGHIGRDAQAPALARLQRDATRTAALDPPR